MAARKSLCSRMRLWELEDQYIIEPLEGGHSQLLSINKRGAHLQFLNEIPAYAFEKNVRRANIFGLLGVVALLNESYFLVITGRELVGIYHGSHVYKIVSMKFLYCTSESRSLSQSEKNDEAHLRKLLKSLETTPGLYLSYEVDLTYSLQKLASRKKYGPLWDQANSRFVWNKQLWESVLQQQVNAHGYLEVFKVPVIQGSFQCFDSKVKGKTIKVSLLARRCIRRIGTRMWRRGANLDGDVANFVESEQILEADGHVASYVQVRGSIPVVWQQVVDLSYKPKIELSNLDETPAVVQRHFKDLMERYGSVLAVDLVNQHGSESVLGMAYGKAMQNIVNDNIQYVPFDFHRICGHVRFDRLSLLFDQISDTFKRQRYFLKNDQGEILEEQKGVVRTNCIDCLDRTNVTQSLLGRKSLEVQLQRLGSFTSSEKISEFTDLDEKFKILWADHGDNISVQYSGTSALKGDFVRHGKRTAHGIFKDGYSALARYYYNNLYDGHKQDALDLAAGHYKVTRGFSFREERKGLQHFTHLPLVTAVVFICLAASTKSLNQARHNTYELLYSLLWALLTAFILKLVHNNGKQFTSRPHLCKLF